MKSFFSRNSWLYGLIVIVLVLFVDQTLKIWIKTNFYLGQEVNVIGDWFILHFTENPGMSFGWKFGGENGKLILSIFRILAISLIGWYMVNSAKRKAHKGFIICIAFIFSGALGNLLDSAFYGLIFSDSGTIFTQSVAQAFPLEGGYAGFLHGSVVDMFYFPLFVGTLPSWMPFVGGNEFLFFSPVFNIADASIFIGTISLIIFQKRFFTTEKDNEEIEEFEQEIE